jgi:hypothetical protein
MFGVFRRDLTAYRYSEGQYVDGIWQEGTETERTISASVQPTSTDDIELLPAGREQARNYTLITEDDLRGLTSANPDQVDIDGERYEVSAIQVWANSIIPHKRAIVTRMEDL